MAFLGEICHRKRNFGYFAGYFGYLLYSFFCFFWGCEKKIVSLFANGMEKLKKILSRSDVRGVLLTQHGEVVEFHNPGVKDLYCLLTTRPHALEGACVADRVIGRGAALLLVRGKVAEVFAQVISSPAVQVLREAGVTVSFGTVVPSIVNRDGTDICPVEKLTMDVYDPEEAFVKIKEFLTNNNIIES